MEIGFLILSDYCEAVNGKAYVMGGGWNMLRLPQIPHEWGFAIAFAIDVPWGETNRRHTLKLHLEDPDGTVVGDEFAFDFESGRPPGAVEGQDQRIVLSLQTRQTFTTTGPHAVVIRVADDEIDRSRFYVLRAPSGDAPA